jgi:hypothetical protein
MFNKDQQRGNKHQAHLAAQLMTDTMNFIRNTYSNHCLSIKNNLLKITSTLPVLNSRPELQLELLFSLGTTFFGLDDYINQNS